MKQKITRAFAFATLIALGSATITTAVGGKTATSAVTVIATP